MPIFNQSSFAKGEIAPALFGRVDTAAYQVALRTARNAQVHAYGGVSNRPGTSWIGPCKDHTYAPRLIDFSFKTTDDYTIEAGNLYMRFIRNDAYVTETALNITGASAADPCVLTVVGHGISTGEEIYVTGVLGMTQLNGRRFTITSLTTDTFSIQDQVTGADIDSSAFTAYSSAGTVAVIYEIETPYATADLDNLKWTQSADVMTISHRSYSTRELTRAAHNAWTLTEPTFAPEQTYPVDTTLTVNGADDNVTYRYKVTATNSESQEESLSSLDNTDMTITGVTAADPAVITSAAHGLTNGDEVEINSIVGMTELNGRRFTVANVATSTFELLDEDSSGYTAYSSAGVANRTFVKTVDGTTAADNTIAWVAAAGAGKYSIYKEDNGIFGFIGDTENVTYTDDNIAADLDVTPPQARNPFLGTGNYPGTASYYEQRRVLGGSTNKPDTSQFSKTGNASNFSRSSPGQDDDAFAATLSARQVNEIRHYVPGNDLLVLTSGSEWRVNSGQDSAFSASSAKQKPQSFWGASHNQPIVSGSTTLFVEENGARVRSLGYSLQLDGYTGTDMTLLAPHIFYSYPIADWCFSRSESLIHVIRADGKAAAMTFQAEQEVIAWTRWDTKGSFERTAALRHEAGGSEASTLDDRVYFVIKRTRGDGETVRYVERLHSRRFVDVRDCFFVDCGASYDDPKTITAIALSTDITITSAAHGFTNGDTVDFFDIKWVNTFDEFYNEDVPDQLNERRYIVSDVATNTFKIKDTAGNYIVGSSFSAYVSGGTVRKALLEITGLDFLEGLEVVILADGNVVNGKTVTDGMITLTRRASRVHVGLRYICDIETLDPEQPQGSRQGQPIRVNSVTVRFEKSRGLYIGHNEDNLVRMKQRNLEAMSSPTDLLTGDSEPLTMPSDWNNKGSVFIRQVEPLPMTVLAVMSDVTLGGTSRDD